MKRIVRLGILSILMLCVLGNTAAALGALGSTTEAYSGAGSLCRETALGDVIADAVRFATDADAALIPGGDIGGRELPAGEQTADTISASLERDEIIVICSLTTSEMYALLEDGVSHMTVDPETTKIQYDTSEYEGFLQVSGFRFCYDIAAPAGERILWIESDRIGRLDRSDKDTVLAVAMTRSLAGHDAKETGLTLSEALGAYINSEISQRYKSLSRITVAGTVDNTIITHIPIGILIALLAVFAAGNGIRRMRTEKDEYDHDNDPDWGL